MVQKLIIDDDAIKLIALKIQGRPVFAGPDGKLLKPGIIDLLDDDKSLGRWLPGNERTRQLVLGTEACRDVLYYMKQFLEPIARKRTMKQLAIPICNLMDIVAILLAKSNDKASRQFRDASWPIQDRETYNKVSKRLRKIRFGSPVRSIRNKLAAHLDPAVFIERVPGPRPDDILEPFGVSVLLLVLSMNYPSQWFSWIRQLGQIADNTHYAIETMYSYPLCVRWITDIDGRVVDLGAMTLAADPRHEVLEQLMEAVASYNNIVKVVSSKLPQISIMHGQE